MTTVRVTRAGLPVAAFLVALAIGTSGAVVGWTSLGSGGDPMWAGEGVGPGLDIGAIAVRNAGAALLLFSGVATFGVTTILSLGLVGVYVGATFAAAAGSVGASQAFQSIALYVPFEFAGLLLAATADLLPAAAVLAGRSKALGGGGRTGLAAYVGATRTSLRTLALGLAAILAGAAVESLVLHAR